jgi:hypothetical protein
MTPAPMTDGTDVTDFCRNLLYPPHPPYIPMGMHGPSEMSHRGRGCLEGGRTGNIRHICPIRHLCGNMGLLICPILYLRGIVLSSLWVTGCGWCRLLASNRTRRRTRCKPLLQVLTADSMPGLLRPLPDGPLSNASGRHRRRRSRLLPHPLRPRRRPGLPQEVRRPARSAAGP